MFRRKSTVKKRTCIVNGCELESPFTCYIRNVNSNLYLEVEKESRNKGSNVIVWSFHGKANQQWHLEPDGTLRNVNSSLILDVKGEKGPDVIVWNQKQVPAAHQQWYFDGSHIISRKDGRLLSVRKYSLKPGSRVVVSPQFNPSVSTMQQTRSQEWIIETAGPKSKQLALQFFIHPPPPLKEGCQIRELRPDLPSAIQFASQVSNNIVQQSGATTSKGTNTKEGSDASNSIFANIWRDEIPAMFFNWVSYKELSSSVEQNEAAQSTHIYAYMIGEVYDAMFDSRLNGYGTWKIVNEYHYEQGVYNSHAIIVENCQSGIAIVCHRGTEKDWSASRANNSLNDWFHSGLNFHLVPWHKNQEDSIDEEEAEGKQSKSMGRVHAGFLNSYKVIRLGIRMQLKRYLDAKYRIIITGHSKGGAIAVLNTLDIIEKFGNAKKNVKCIQYGAPKVGDIDFVNYFNSVVPADQVQHFITSFPTSFAMVDLISLLPVKTGLYPYEHVHGTTKYIQANVQYFGNPDPIKGVNFIYSPQLPISICIHGQQVYLDGLLKELVADKPFVVDHIETFKHLTGKWATDIKEIIDSNNEFVTKLFAAITP